MASDKRTNRIFSSSNGIQRNLRWERSQPIELMQKVVCTDNLRISNKVILISGSSGI